MDKMQFMLDNFRNAFPTRAARYEREWAAMHDGKKPNEAPKIDWSKPLTCNNSAVTNIEYVEQLYVRDLGYVHLCRLTYRQGYTYYTMYTDEGRTVGTNAGTINVKNKAEQVTRHYAINKATGCVVATAESEVKASDIAYERGFRHHDLTFTSHTFTR